MGRFSKIREVKLSEQEKALLGRHEDEFVEERSKARFVVQAQEHSGFATDSVMCCKLYESEDGCDRAGVVLSLTTKTATSVLLPHAEVTEAGLDLHLCGAEECETTIRVLVRALLRSSYKNVVLREAAVALADSFAQYRDRAGLRAGVLIERRLFLPIHTMPDCQNPQ